MKREEFIQNLEGIIVPLLKYTEELCWNKLCHNYRYTIKPNLLEDSDHLDEFERKLLKQRNNEIDTTYSISEIADRLVHNERVPVWINVSVYKIGNNWTTIELLISRRLRKELKDLYHRVGYPPFHISIPMPPFRKEGQKFDANWRHKIWKIRLKAILWKWRNRPTLNDLKK